VASPSSSAATRSWADDLTCIKLLDERELSASSRPLNRGYMECRGIGIINIADMFGVKSIRLEKRIDLVVSLREWSPDVVEEPGLEENFYDILGVKVPQSSSTSARPRHRAPRRGRALVQALKNMGHDRRRPSTTASSPHGRAKGARATSTRSPPIRPSRSRTRTTRWKRMLPDFMPARIDGRSADQLRPLTIEANVAPYASGSVLLASAPPRICAATIEARCPRG